MNISKIPIQYNGYFIFDPPSQARYLKKNFKGRKIAYLTPLSAERINIDTPINLVNTSQSQEIGPPNR